MLHYPKTDPCPTCHVLPEEPCVHYGTDKVRDEPHLARMPEWWNPDWSEGYAAALAEAKTAVEEWFTDVSLDDMYLVHGWAPRP